jgi:hypothetical protein
MNGARRPMLALIVALVLWEPSGRALFGGDLKLDTALIRLLMAIGASYAGMSLLSWITAGYGARRTFVARQPSPADSSNADSMDT